MSRRAAAAALLGLALVAAAAGPARAGTFSVSQCNAVAGGGLSPRAYQAGLWWVDAGWPAVDCGAGGGAIRIGTAHWRLPDSGTTVTRLALPGSMPRTTARAAWLDWRFNPQAASTNPAFLIASAGGARLFEAVAGEGTTPGAAVRRALPAGSRGLELMVYCSTANGPGWCNWGWYLLELRGVTLELEESGEPSVTEAGALVAGGRRSGVVPLEIVATDGDSGVRRVSVSLGGVARRHARARRAAAPTTGCRRARRRCAASSTSTPGSYRTATGACGSSSPTRPATRTRGTPGPCSWTTGRSRTRRQAPARPRTAPARAWAPGPARAPAPPLRSPARPRRRAFRRTRSRAAVTWRTAATRASEPGCEPGWSPAGHAPARSCGAAASRLPYGQRVRIRGRLTDEHGRGIGRATLAAIRREPGRPWRTVTGVRTRPDGRFTAFTRIGPSQELRFVYYAYGDSARGRAQPGAPGPGDPLSRRRPCSGRARRFNGGHVRKWVRPVAAVERVCTP